MYFRINKLTSINWINSSIIVEDIDDEVDTTAKLKWTKRTLKYLSPAIPNGTKYLSIALTSFYNVLYPLLFQSVFLFSWFRLLWIRNKILLLKFYNLNVTNNRTLRERNLDRKSFFQDGNEHIWFWSRVHEPFAITIPKRAHLKYLLSEKETGGQLHAPAALSRKNVQYLLYRGLGGAWGRSGRQGKCWLHRDSTPGLCSEWRVAIPTVLSRLSLSDKTGKR
jgi:hypothetical protein